MHPVTVFPTRRPAEWRGPALLAAAGLAATVLYLLRRQAMQVPRSGPQTRLRLPALASWRSRGA